MPAYDFACTKCGYGFTRLLRIAEIDIPLGEPCPECTREGHIQRIICAPLIGDSFRLGVSHHKTNTDFKSRLKQIHDNHPGSCIAATSHLTKI